MNFFAFIWRYIVKFITLVLNCFVSSFFGLLMFIAFVRFGKREKNDKNLSQNALKTTLKTIKKKR
jgi:UPF0716 family protein affecting phage T7 exclusion